MSTEGVLSYTDACAMLGLAFMRDYGLVDSGERVSEYSPIRAMPASDYDSVSPIRALIVLYLDLNVGEVYKGMTIDDWLDMDIQKRDMLLSELKFFDERKEAAAKAAKEAAEKEAK